MSNPAESLNQNTVTTGTPGKQSALPTVTDDSWAASLLLAFLSSAGLYYVNIFPVIVSALMEGAGLSNAQAGEITFANTIGAVVGAFAISWVVKKIHRWKTAAAWLLCLSMSMDLATISLAQIDLLIPLRFVHGVLGGALVGIGFAVIARSAAPGRCYSMVLIVQYTGGAFGMLVLPALVSQHGTYVPFYALLVFSSITLLMLPFIGDYPLPESPAENVQRPSQTAERIEWHPLLVTLFALFLFQFANMALFAFIFDLGKSFGLEQAFMSETLFAANFIAISGAILAAWTSTRYRITGPLVLALVLTVLGILLFVYSGNKAVFVFANIATGITWAFCVPYFLTMASRFDKAGQMAAFGGFASKTGLACGPLVAGYFISGGGTYTQMIVIAAALLALCLLSLPAARHIDSATELADA